MTVRPKNIKKAEWRAMSDAQKEYITTRQEPGVMWQTTYSKGLNLKPEYKIVGEWDDPANPGRKLDIVETRHGICPCATCGHTTSDECTDADCDCCDEVCT